MLLQKDGENVMTKTIEMEWTKENMEKLVDMIVGYGILQGEDDGKD